MQILRSLFLAVILAASCWFEFGQDHSLGELRQIIADRSDPRPARQILLIGNSRTYMNDMPAMLRQIADSAGAPQKYQTLMIAYGGASFHSLWDNWRVKRETAKAWDDAIVQGESRGQSDPDQAASFMADGTNLIKELHPHDLHPLLIVNWAYDRSEYPDDEGRAAHYRMIQDAHADLARRTGARAVNVGKVWEFLHINLPGVPLTSDGNHPTVAASYFVALCLFANLSDNEVARVKWAPDGVSADDAAQIRRLVDQYRSALQ